MASISGQEYQIIERCFTTLLGKGVRKEQESYELIFIFSCSSPLISQSQLFIEQRFAIIELY